MEPHVRWSRPLTGLGLVLSMTILAACNGAGAAPTTGAGASGASEPSMAPASEVATGTEGPTNMLVTSINLLPTASFDPKKVSVACDAATLGTSASMSCDDLVSAAVRIATTMSKTPVTQVSVTKPADNPTGIQVTFWVQAEDASGLTAFTTTIDPAAGSFTFPVEDDAAVFPTAS
jgi:hypothetical protein